MTERVFRDEWGRVAASLVGFSGDFDLAEDVSRRHPLFGHLEARPIIRERAMMVETQAATHLRDRASDPG